MFLMGLVDLCEPDIQPPKRSQLTGWKLLPQVLSIGSGNKLYSKGILWGSRLLSTLPGSLPVTLILKSNIPLVSMILSWLPTFLSSTHLWGLRILQMLTLRCLGHCFLFNLIFKNKALTWEWHLISHQETSESFWLLHFRGSGNMIKSSEFAGTIR